MTTSAAPARTLADELRARDDAAVARLLAARPDLVSPVPADMTNLVARASTRSSVARALDGLDRFTLQVLDAIAVLPEPADSAAVRRLLPAGAEAVGAAAEALRDRALLWGPDDALRLVRTVRDAVGPAPGRVGPPLAVALDAYPAERLTALLTDLGLPPATDAATAAARLAATIGEPAALARLLADAPAEAVELLERLDRDGPAGQVERADRDIRAGTAATPLEWLLARGVLVARDAGTVVLPAEVAIARRGGALYPDATAQPSPPETTPIGAGEVDRAAAGEAMATLRAAEDLLERWSTDPPGVLRTGGGGLGVRDLRRIQDALDLDAAGAALLIEVVHAAGLLAADGEEAEAWLPTPGYDRWLALDPAERWAALAGAWLAGSRVAALVGSRADGAGSARDRPLAALGRDLDRAGAPELRGDLLGELAALPAGTAASEASLAARAAWARPRRARSLSELLVPATLREGAQLGVLGRGALASFARPLLAGDTAGAACLLAPQLPAPLDHVLLQADLTAVAPGPLVRPLALELALAADVESTGAATVYRFCEASVRRALDAGRTAAELHDLLARASRTPVPQPLDYLIDDVARRHGRLRVGTAGAYLRCDDETTLAALVGDKRAARLGLRRLAPTVAVAEVAVDALLARLRELGYAPAAESRTGAVLTHRPDARRTAPRVPPRPVGDRAEPAPQLLAAAVRALRAGDRAAAAGARRRTDAEGRTAPNGLDGPRRSVADTLGRLRLATESGASVWLGYVGDDGTATDRIVDPIAVEGGVLRAFDHRQNRVRSFALARISAVADA